MSAATEPAFRDGRVAAAGIDIRYREAGDGAPLVALNDAGEPSFTRGHALLSRDRRIVAFATAGLADGPAHPEMRRPVELAATLAAAATALGLDRFDLLGAGRGGSLALWLAAQFPERVGALVLEAPAAIRPAGSALDRDADLEARLRRLALPVLVLFGTRDPVIPPEMGRHYKALLANGHLAFVYDAGHAISADRPAAFAEIAGDFLNRSEAFAISRTRTTIHP